MPGLGPTAFQVPILGSRPSIAVSVSEPADDDARSGLSVFCPCWLAPKTGTAIGIVHNVQDVQVVWFI